MRTRLILAAVCILGLPLWFSASQGNRGANSAPFATVAYAGHVATGGWCECGSSAACICDPGEVPVGQSTRPVTDQTKRPADRGAPPIRARSGFDYGSGALMLALALLVWSRLRA